MQPNKKTAAEKDAEARKRASEKIKKKPNASNVAAFAAFNDPAATPAFNKVAQQLFGSGADMAELVQHADAPPAPPIPPTVNSSSSSSGFPQSDRVQELPDGRQVRGSEEIEEGNRNGGDDTASNGSDEPERNTNPPDTGNTSGNITGQQPALLMNRETWVFGPEKSTYFMDDNHAKAMDAPVKSSADIDDLERRCKNHAREYPSVGLNPQNWFSHRAQTKVEDFCETLGMTTGKIWETHWEGVIAVLRKMYPKSHVAATTVLTTAVTAAKAFLRKDVNQRETGLHRYVQSRSPLDNNQALMARTREVFEGAGLAHTDAKAALQGPSGDDLVRFYRKELRRSTDVWDVDLSSRLDAFETDLRNRFPEWQMSFAVLQRVVGAKINAYVEAIHNLRAQGGTQAGGYLPKAVVHAVNTERFEKSNSTYAPGYDNAGNRTHDPALDDLFQQDPDLAGLLEADLYALSTGQHPQSQNRDFRKSWDQPYGNQRASYPPRGQASHHYAPQGQSRDFRRSNTPPRKIEVPRGHPRGVPGNANPRGFPGNAKPDKVVCTACGKLHPGPREHCEFVVHRHPDVNTEPKPFRESKVYKALQSVHPSIHSLTYGLALVNTYTTDRKFACALLPTTLGPRKPENPNVNKHGVSSINIELYNASANETININSVFSEYAKRNALVAATDTEPGTVVRNKRKNNIHNFNVSACADQKQMEVLLDSGCIGRDFVSHACCIKLNLVKQKLKYPIHISSIHGNEIATEVVILNNFILQCEDQEVTIPAVQLVVIETAPTDVIIGLITLREHEVFRRLTRYFGKTERVSGGLAVNSGRVPNEPACIEPMTTCASLSTKRAQRHLASARVHVSELLPT